MKVRKTIKEWNEKNERAREKKKKWMNRRPANGKVYTQQVK